MWQGRATKREQWLLLTKDGKIKVKILKLPKASINIIGSRNWATISENLGPTISKQWRRV